ncbi:hypothetical protein [Klebsiella pneumoniae]
MTDITELAQSLKRRATSANEFGESLYVKANDVIALVEALEKAQRANGYLREQSAEWERKAISNFEDCAEMSARVEELESQRKLAFTASNRWADKFREAEKRIAELESRTVTVKLPQRYDLIGETDGNCSLNDAEMAPDNDGVYLRVRDVREMLTAAGIKVEAE